MRVRLRVSNFVPNRDGLDDVQVWNYCAMYAHDMIEANRAPWLIAGEISVDEGKGFDDLFPVAISLDVDDDWFPPDVNVRAVVGTWVAEHISPSEDSLHDVSLVAVV